MADDNGRQAEAGSMLGFYWRLLRDTPKLLWQAGDRVVTGVGLFVAMLAGLNREWLAQVDAQ